MLDFIANIEYWKFRASLQYYSVINVRINFQMYFLN